MAKLLEGVHPSAVQFNGLSEKVISDTAVPEAEIQVHQQEPVNGLYYRHSGRLLTTHEQGKFPERARAGLSQGTLFELQRTGTVVRQTPYIVTARRANPVHCIDARSTSGYVAIRWLDEAGIHQAVPSNEKQLPFSVTVQSWLGNTVMSRDFLIDPTGCYDQKTRSTAENDPALELYYSALRAYTDLSSRTA